MDLSNDLKAILLISIPIIIIIWVGVIRIVDPPSERVDTGYICTETYSLNTGPTCY